MCLPGYHFAVVYQNVDTSLTLPTGRIFVYVNGQLVTMPNLLQVETVVPDVARPLSYLGRSCSAGNQLLNGAIDSFRVFDQALTGAQVSALYYNSMGGCAVQYGPTGTIADVTPNTVPSATSAPTPFFSLTASTDPRPSAGVTNRTALYGWKQEDQGDVLCGVSQYHQVHYTAAHSLSLLPRLCQLIRCRHRLLIAAALCISCRVSLPL